MSKVHNGRRRNALEKDVDHPIEVTRHYRQGPPGYLSPWQRAAALGQNELFETGIKLSKRASEIRARRGTPGASKRVYQSGLKEATAGQLGRLARIGLRTGLTPSQIAADLKKTGRFTAGQISQAIDAARQAEKRKNPIPATKFSAAQIEQLRQQYGHIQKVDPDGPVYKQLQAYLKEVKQTSNGPDLLKQLANARVKWLSYEAAKMLGYGPSEAFKISRGMQTANPARTSKTRKLYEKFSGKKAKRQTTLAAPKGTPAQVAKLGRLRMIRTTDGRKWNFVGSKAPFLTADHKGKLHVVGGQYRANPAGEDLGEIERIEYETTKPHLGQTQPTIYFHELGEETGERPTLEIDDEGLIRICGGAYRIEADGIHN